ncbi:MAG: hypothetical protein LBE44_15820, partial [Microbacterium hominis]|nr:hypothetical protein [Microbacterium hominis]
MADAEIASTRPPIAAASRDASDVALTMSGMFDARRHDHEAGEGGRGAHHGDVDVVPLLDRARACQICRRHG